VTASSLWLSAISSEIQKPNFASLKIYNTTFLLLPAKRAARREQEERTGKKMRGRKPKAPDPEQAQPEAKAQRNFTHPESRIMPDGANKGSFLQGYNAQAAVDATAQVIVAAEVTQETTDHRRFSLRGLDKVRREWKLVCLTSNLLKLFSSGWKPRTA